MANALPLLLIGGAAVLMLGGKKKKSRSGACIVLDTREKYLNISGGSPGGFQPPRYPAAIIIYPDGEYEKALTLCKMAERRGAWVAMAKVSDLDKWSGGDLISAPLVGIQGIESSGAEDEFVSWDEIVIS